jgi:hypothetical protein
MPTETPPLLRLTLAGMVAALVLHLLVLLYGGWSGIHAPTAIEYGEPFIVSASYYSASGGSLYAPVDDLPFLHNNYNPLVQLAVGPMLADGGPSYAPIRAVTLGSILFILLLLAWMVRRSTGSRVAAVVGALLPLTCGFMFPWMCVGRVDGFATLCSVGAFAWAVAHQDASWRRRAWFLVLAWVAFAAKQSVVGGCGAALLLALSRGRWKECFGLGLVFTAGCAAIVGVAQWLSDGQYWLHAIAYNASHDRGSWWPQTLPPLEMARAIGWPLLLLAVLILPRVRREDAPWVCWLVVTLPLAFLLVRKSGSHMHYFLESVGALSVLGAIVGTRAVRAWTSLGWTRRTAALIALVALASAPGIPWKNPRTWQSGGYFKWQQAKGLRRLVDSADPVPAEVRRRITSSKRSPLLLAQTATIAIECGRPAIFDVADFARLQALGRWSAEDRLLPMIRARRFPVVAIQHFKPDFTDGHLFTVDAIDGLKAAIETHYRPLPGGFVDRSKHEATFWVPKD